MEAGWRTGRDRLAQGSVDLEATRGDGGMRSKPAGLPVPLGFKARDPCDQQAQAFGWADNAVKAQERVHRRMLGGWC